MKKAGLLFFGIFILISCGNTSKSKDSDINTQKIVGNDKDEHDCVGSAGYTWSELKQDCVRLFEAGQRLNSVIDETEKPVFVLFNDDQSKLELFLPNEKSTVILSALEKGKYTSGNYNYIINTKTLMINGKPAYKSSK
ncbi:hypothetical protein [Tamlana sp. I1]|uniref:hypothetical protein n=1 Tax=Tamlana sp. I1 TaxID=2762061 RepID=UPI00188F4A17|nr:hypothetical protein [Tamlana sp. I1]